MLEPIRVLSHLLSSIVARGKFFLLFFTYIYVLRPSLFYCTNKFGLFGDHFVGWSFHIVSWRWMVSTNTCMHLQASLFVWTFLGERPILSGTVFFMLFLFECRVFSFFVFLSIWRICARCCISVRFPINAGKVYHYKKKKETKETKRQPYSHQSMCVLFCESEISRIIFLIFGSPLN